jgi:hypothetical protein
VEPEPRRAYRVSIMISFDIGHEPDPLESEEDLERRRELRSFLMHRRSTLAPLELGLPRTARRRVAGLRRGEVAELIGVSVDWYRFFESGRPVRVSPQFIARLSRALRLSAAEHFTLFRLSLPEMYRVDVLA